jgi:LCP family protein required for cell wall assembly
VSLIPKSRGGALWRFALAAVIIIGCSAAATAVGGLLQVKQFVDYLDQTKALKNADVNLPHPGQPQTLLLIGSDHRASDPDYRDANTDTMMLVRVDDSSSTINVLSIPRDLKVQLPDGTAKLNEAYSEGGPNLLIKTLRTQVFPTLKVNHILDVNFRGFSDLVDAIGCVYTDVDHRYYNLTQPYPSPNNYSSIDIEPGYQKLCGDNQAETGALAFVRFRHTDTDIVRNARQQDFLRWAKEGYSAGDLVSNRNKLFKIFGANVQTDHNLHTEDGLLDLFGLVVNADGLAVKQIPFPAILETCVAGGQTPCYVNADVAQTTRAYQQFMTPTTPAPKSSSHKPHHSHKLSNAGLVADVNDAKNQSLDLGKLGFPVYYPKLMVANTDTWSPAYCSSLTGNCDNGFEPAAEYEHSYPRKYAIHGQHGGVYPSYRMTVVLNSGLGEYYGIQGTTWLHPPILNDPSGTQTVSGKQLMIYKNGQKISLVAWRTATGSYWISNTLNDAIGNNQMIALAGSFTGAP